ncbi:hypothetical protein PAXRUDRAFT_21573 [Paxillus rubicundulus Ve08.2h10]|uniref:Uncharacterized protein n=1 Tax=Paxillus rubicundulus Ve08.2h10 TaxID=930991 RepID=A0A0D0CZ73_9AGAM|nr:hypothetical protein PAXRUDRAFT_21573 [Paxillus rubicundulus Ve08.2h10]
MSELLPRQSKAEHEDAEEETPELGAPDLCGTVGLDNAPPDAPEAQWPPSPTINDLTNRFEQLHMDPSLAPAPAPAPPRSLPEFGEAIGNASKLTGIGTTNGL